MKKSSRYFFHLVLALIILGLAYAAWEIRPTANFPNQSAQPISIVEGTSITGTAQLLQQANVIRSPLIFRVLLKIMGGSHGALAGDYWFETPLSTFTIAWRVAQGKFVANPVKITIPESLNPTALTSLILKKFPNLDKVSLAKLVQANIAELAPDTYFWPPGITADRLISALKRHFARETAALAVALAQSGRTRGDVLILASLVEREASDYKTRQLIAGILWKRLDAGMLLQVDVARETYKVKGLPASGAISNVSLEAYQATLEPINSPYWYYLADKHGQTHYGVTFNDHKANQQKYLR